MILKIITLKFVTHYLSLCADLPSSLHDANLDGEDADRAGNAGRGDAGARGTGRRGRRGGCFF